MIVDNVFRILEIEPTNDKKEIKKAYARLVKRYHPEEHPEEWGKIHDAYEQALKIAEHGRPLIWVEPSVQMEAPEPPLQEEAPEDEPPVQEEDLEAGLPEMIDEEKEERRPPKSEEMDALFDNIGEIAREKRHQDQEVFKRKVQEVMNDFRKISGENKLDIKEWEAFFDQETRLPYVCTREFLEMLGDCFENRTIECEMYCFLKKQLAVITEYSRDEKIELQNIGLLNPVDYAEKKIYKAYAGESASKSGDDAGTRRRKTRKAVWIILIIVGTFIRSIAKYARHPQEMPKSPERSITVMENMIADIEAEKATADSANDTAEKVIAYNSVEDDGDFRRIHMLIIPDKIQIGDSREVMIEAFGEPEEIREAQENPDDEEAVYSSFGFGGGLVIVLQNDVITDIYIEYAMEED